MCSNPGAFTCCGIWPFGRLSRSGYRRLPSESRGNEKINREIALGLPPGISVGDLIENAQNREIVDQAYALAVQCNKINEYLSRFDTIQIPQECQAVAGAQMSKLKAARQIIWNALLAIASQGISMNEASLKTFVEKQADDSLALLEMEKLITAIKLDENQLWATDIAHMITTSQPTRTQKPSMSQEGLMTSDMTPPRAGTPILPKPTTETKGAAIKYQTPMLCKPHPETNHLPQPALISLLP
ncbi:tegument protein [Vombatid gammaherpesvirus 1]|uniref:Tegument protein n=1 Tax=Vombatid gammaherpesvirus 1 TaxID=2052651 RepID=A0A3Q8J5Z8_9GAMA|nr:tegument protein [Vombatid gammaherpesvirus 1]AZB49153.1 tegument protein [Vombatid gammaherpesvirus 1]